MSIKFIISFEIAGFADSKSGFEQGRPYREEAGISWSEPYRKIDLPNGVCLTGTATCKESFLEFFLKSSSLDLKESTVSAFLTQIWDFIPIL